MKKTKKLLLMLTSLLVALPFTTSCILTPPIPGRPNVESSPTEADKPVESSQPPVETETVPMETETPVVPTPAHNFPFLHGEFEQHGYGTIDVYLMDAMNFFIDIEHQFGKVLSKMWDTYGTYTIRNGLIHLSGRTQGCKADDPDNIFGTDMASYDIRMDVIQDVAYATSVFELRIDNDVKNIELRGSWNYDAVFLQGEYENHGAGTATLKLINANEFVLDVEHVAGKMFSKMWDTKGFYQIENGKITLTGETTGCRANDPDNLFNVDIPSYPVTMEIIKDAEFGYKTMFELIGDKGAVTYVEMVGEWPLGHFHGV